MIQIITKRLGKIHVEDIPHEIPYGYGLTLALALARIYMSNGAEYAHIINGGYDVPSPVH